MFVCNLLVIRGQIAPVERVERSAPELYSFYPLSASQGAPSGAYIGGRNTDETASRWLLSFVTSTAPTVTVVFSSKATTIVTCLNPSKITAC